MRKMLAIIFVFVFLISACSSGSGHPKDTCTPGANMTDPRIVQPFDPLAKNAILDISWDAGTQRGAELPDSYFDAVIISPDTAAEIAGYIKSVYQSDKRVISIEFSGLDIYLEKQSDLEMILEFPDRALYIDCAHSGMQDRYLLFITLHFVNGVLDSSSIIQQIEFGPI